MPHDPTKPTDCPDRSSFTLCQLHQSDIALLRTIPTYAMWLDVLDPISNVFPVGGLHNTLRRLVARGAPVVTGLHAIGDSVCTTNPTLGRGLSLALSGAVDLLETIDKHPDDWTAQALELDNLVADHVVPVL